MESDSRMAGGVFAGRCRSGRRRADMKLSDVASVTAGYHFRGPVELASHGVPVLQMKDFPGEGELLPSPEELPRTPVDDGARFTVAEGDVLYLARGARNDVSVVEADHAGFLVPSYVLILRPNPTHLLPHFLAWHLTQPEARQHLESHRTGTTQVAVPVSAVRDLEVILPPLPLQSAIAEIQKLAAAERRLHRKLEQRRQQIANRVTRQALEQWGGKNRSHEKVR